jgi:hypothetical protein
MPLNSAKNVLDNDKATRKEINQCINNIEREIGYLNCVSNKEPQLLPNLIELHVILAELNEKQNLINGRIDFLQEEIPRVEAVVANLENGGVERFDNQPPHEDFYEGKSYTAEELKKIPPEIYQKSGSDFLRELREKLASYKTELSHLKS